MRISLHKESDCHRFGNSPFSILPPPVVVLLHGPSPSPPDRHSGKEARRPAEHRLRRFSFFCLKTFLVSAPTASASSPKRFIPALTWSPPSSTFSLRARFRRPADERHPYGHGKFENFSAFIETAC